MEGVALNDQPSQSLPSNITNSPSGRSLVRIKMDIKNFMHLSTELE
jgi:hypothetical protein